MNETRQKILHAKKKVMYLCISHQKSNPSDNKIYKSRPHPICTNHPKMNILVSNSELRQGKNREEGERERERENPK